MPPLPICRFAIDDEDPLARLGRASLLEMLMRKSPANFSPIREEPRERHKRRNRVLQYSYICGNICVTQEVIDMKFIGVREFKQDAVKYLNEGTEIVVMKRKKPIARLVPVQEKSSEMVLLEIGRVLSEAGISREEALKALDMAKQDVHG
jgi:antitoxin (DNA-binding transcriptional repressor) of toxin-antitoxin stability system